jgi:protein SCO1/2
VVSVWCCAIPELIRNAQPPVSDCSVNPEQKGVLKMNMAVNIVQTKVTVGITVILTVLLCVPSVSADEILNQESTFRASPASDSEMIDRTDRLPEELEDIGVVEHLEAQVPLDITFRDEYGKDVKLGNYFQGNKPVLLTLVYFRCPMLCNLILNGVIESLQQMEMTPGKEFELVTISFDPLETHTLAQHKKQNYIKEYGKPEAASGWHFLTGRESNIRKVADAIGFKYKYNEKTEEFMHTSSIFILTPEGKVSRYLYGIVYHPQTLRLSLVEASQGKIGSPMDQLLLYCYHYDPSTGSYAPVAMNIMRAGSMVVLITLAAFISVLWRRESIMKRFRGEGSQS